MHTQFTTPYEHDARLARRKREKWKNERHNSKQVGVPRSWRTTFLSPGSLGQLVINNLGWIPAIYYTYQLGGTSAFNLVCQFSLPVLKLYRPEPQRKLLQSISDLTRQASVHVSARVVGVFHIPHHQAKHLSLRCGQSFQHCSCQRSCRETVQSTGRYNCIQEPETQTYVHMPG